MYRVDFKENNSEELGLITLDPGRRQRAQEQTNVYPMPYSDYEPTEHTGKYKPYERPMEFYVPDEDRISLINSWLAGYGKLRVFKDPGGYFKASVISGLEYEEIVKVKDKMRVVFKINPPFFYLDSGDTTINLTAPASLTNPGTHTADPYIKITGTGNVNLDINGAIVVITAIDGYIVIDSESKYVYRDTINQGDKMEGEFPKLPPGVNNIAWTGTVTKIEIIPRWREL